MSRQRDAVYQIILDAHSHLSADDIYVQAKQQLPSIVLATVYNNLNALSDSGKIRRITMEGGPDRYDIDQPKHDHLICEQCGKITDISLPKIEEYINHKLHVTITSYHLQLRFQCEDCLKKAGKN